MMTLLSVSEAPRKRRRYTAEFKARVVAACQQPDASVAGVARDHGLNTNLVHKWIRTTQQPQPSTSPSFIPITLPTPPDQKMNQSPADSIRIEIPRAGGNVVVSWPVAQADRCLLWLQELLR